MLSSDLDENFTEYGELTDKNYFQISTLLDKLLSQLRLTTLMRSVDVSNLIWGLFEAEGHFSIRGTDKQWGGNHL